MTIKGTVVRDESSVHGTQGAMELENGFKSDTMELQWLNNQRGVSCTAPGVDHGRVWFSPHLQRPVIRYADRNGRQDCLVHNGNFASEAEGEITQIHGCTEVGRGYAWFTRQTPSGPRQQWGIKNSVVTLEELIKSLEIPGADHVTDQEGYISGYEDVEITYSWAPGKEPA